MTFDFKNDKYFFVEGKIEKVPRGIQNKKLRKDTAISVKLVSTIGA